MHTGATVFDNITNSNVTILLFNTDISYRRDDNADEYHTMLANTGCYDDYTQSSHNYK